MVPNGALLIRHYFKTDDRQPVQTDSWYKGSAAVAPANMQSYAQALATAAQTNLQAPFAAWMAGDSHYLGCTAHLYSSSLVGIGRELNPVGTVGTLTGDTCPDYVSAIVRKYTQTPGRNGRGRQYIPCVAEINTDTSLLTDDGFDALGDIADGILTTLSDPGDGAWEAGHYDRKTPAIVSPVSLRTIEVLTTQRRRRLRLLA